MTDIDASKVYTNVLYEFTKAAPMYVWCERNLPKGALNRIAYRERVLTLATVMGWSGKVLEEKLNLYREK